MNTRLSVYFCIASAAGVLTGCGTVAELVQPPVVEEGSVGDEAAARPELTIEEELGQLMAQMRHDLTRFLEREKERIGRMTSRDNAANAQQRRHLGSIDNGSLLGSVDIQIPVVGVSTRQLRDSWGEPRDGGRRSHKGIDIFAPRGTELVAVANGYISYIGTQPKGGRCVWLVTDAGYSFYYAHLDRWAPGIYEGMQVRRGDLLGYVGNTGNAANSPPHLHFGVVDNDTTVNPYHLLKNAEPTLYAKRGGDMSSPIQSGSR